MSWFNILTIGFLFGALPVIENFNRDFLQRDLQITVPAESQKMGTLSIDQALGIWVP